MCELIGARAVTEFNYRISDSAQAHVFVGLAVSNREEADQIADELRTHGFDTINLTDDELSKLHLRHLVGGHSKLASGERLYRFVFPERPGALMRFLSAMPTDWNISLFHYRSQGSDYGRILIGLQIPSDATTALQDFSESIDYPFVEETDNPVYKLFLS